MSFTTFKKEDLLKVADDFGVEVQSSDTKAVILAALAEDGVTYETYTQLSGDDSEESVSEPVVAEKKSSGQQHLIRMSRANPTFEVRGYKFTKASPFCVVDSEDAEWITDNIEGFRYATPREAQEFYG